MAARCVGKGREEEEGKEAVEEGQTDRNGGEEVGFLRTSYHIWLFVFEEAKSTAGRIWLEA